jgi:hypothetical protein
MNVGVQNTTIEDLFLLSYCHYHLHLFTFSSCGINHGHRTERISTYLVGYFCEAFASTDPKTFPPFLHSLYKAARQLWRWIVISFSLIYPLPTLLLFIISGRLPCLKAKYFFYTFRENHTQSGINANTVSIMTARKEAGNGSAISPHPE